MSRTFTYTVVEYDDAKIVLENKGGERLTIPRGWLPSSAKVGDGVTATVHEHGGRGQLWFTVTKRG